MTDEEIRGPDGNSPLKLINVQYLLLELWKYRNRQSSCVNVKMYCCLYAAQIAPVSDQVFGCQRNETALVWIKTWHCLKLLLQKAKWIGCYDKQRYNFH